DVLFPLTALWTVACSIVGVHRLWAGFRDGPDSPLDANGFSWKHLFPTVSDILRHSYFRECVVSWRRYVAHFNMVWGFIMLAVTTTCVAAGVYLFHEETPYPLANPIKWIGNAGALLLLVGSFLAVADRLSKPGNTGKS